MKRAASSKQHTKEAKVIRQQDVCRFFVSFDKSAMRFGQAIFGVPRALEKNTTQEIRVSAVVETKGQSKTAKCQIGKTRIRRKRDLFFKKKKKVETPSM